MREPSMPTLVRNLRASRFAAGALGCVLLAALLAAWPTRAAAQSQLPEILEAVKFSQRPGSQVPGDITLRDHTGAFVQLERYFGEKPIVLHLAYFRCPMLCNMTRDGLITSLSALSLEPGKEFTVLTVSFDPREGPELAADARETVLERYGRRRAAKGWHFLTGDQASLDRLLEAVGFRARWDDRSGSFAHPAGVIVLTPEGVVSRYLSGVEFAARDLRLSLVEASAHRIGSITDQVLLFCFMYDPQLGRYGFAVMTAVRVGGVLTVSALLIGVGILLHRERREARRNLDASGNDFDTIEDCC